MHSKHSVPDPYHILAVPRNPLVHNFLVSPRTTRHPHFKSISSPFLHSDVLPSPPPYTPVDPSTQNISETEDDRDDSDSPNAFTRSSTSNIRTRLFGGARVRDKPKLISTTPGHLCAGETETETDEPSRILPTARIVVSSGLLPSNSFHQRLIPFFFEFSRLLSIVPAIFGTLYNLFHTHKPPSPGKHPWPPPERVDYFISALWAILTGWQCLCLTTGLLTRWRIYYPPLSTLVRLLALQGICWQATHLTLTLLEHEKRPVIVWAIIGTTTCTSRSVQIWVTSNLWWEKLEDGPPIGSNSTEENRRVYSKRWGGKWGGRRWDWNEVTLKCVLPAGIVYFVMAWADQLRREWDRNC